MRKKSKSSGQRPDQRDRKPGGFPADQKPASQQGRGKSRGRHNRSHGDTGTRQPRDKGLILFGHHPVRAALENPERVSHRLLATRAGLERLGQDPARLNIEVEMVDGDRLETLLGDGAVHQGLALRCAPLDPLGLEDVLPALDGTASAPLIFLDQVTDPHNVGAILRSAAIFGARAVVATDRHAPPETGTLAKAASGALETVPLIRVTNLARAMEKAQEAGYWTLGLTGDGADPLPSLRPDRRIALVLGSEGDGMRRLTADHCDQLVQIPMAENPVGSLNVSNAAAIALYAITTAQKPG